MRLLLLLLLIPVFTRSQTGTVYKNLALEGGGIRALAYSGALKVLEDKGILENIENVAGTSSGAVVGLLICLGYNSSQVDSVFQTLDPQKFNDGKNIFSIIHRLKKEYGVYRGSRFEKWLSRIIELKTGSANTTFLQLHELRMSNRFMKDLYCTGTNVSKQKMQTFSWQATPTMELRTAVHISGCIPVYFKPVAIDSSWGEVSVKNNKRRFDLYVDGGMTNNYPINMFDTCLNGPDPFNCETVKYNMKTLGLKLERPEQIESFEHGITDIAPHPITSLNDYKLALINLLQEILGRKTINLVNEKDRTIFISYGNVFGKIRKVSKAEKTELYNNGVTAANNFFNKKQ